MKHPIMRFDIVTLFHEMIQETVSWGVTGRALELGLVELETWNPRDYTNDRHRTVDDRPYGGGPGMVMKVEPLREAISAKFLQSRIICYLFESPRPKTEPRRGTALCQVA